jgi:hypothetical protein
MKMQGFDLTTGMNIRSFSYGALRMLVLVLVGILLLRQSCGITFSGMPENACGG